MNKSSFISIGAAVSKTGDRVALESLLVLKAKRVRDL